MKQLRFEFLTWLLCAFLAGLITGCAHPDGSRGSVTRGADKLDVYQVKGVVEKVEADGKSVMISHEKIPGYMDAMTMSFDVKDAKELIGLSEGDIITFRMLVNDDEGWIDRVQKIGRKGSEPPKPRRDEVRKAPIVEPLNIGDAVPDYRFTNQFNQPISLSQFRGKALAIVFIYTRCPYPNFCPRMSSNFQEVQKRLKAMPGAPKNWHLLSISFDPVFDTPSRLKDYAESVRYDPAWWSFATSDLWTLDGITEQLGLQFWREEGAVIGHNVRAAVLDPQGRLQHVFTGTKWQPSELAGAIIKSAGKP